MLPLHICACTVAGEVLVWDVSESCKTPVPHRPWRSVFCPAAISTCGLLAGWSPQQLQLAAPPRLLFEGLFKKHLWVWESSGCLVSPGVSSFYCKMSESWIVWHVGKYSEDGWTALEEDVDVDGRRTSTFDQSRIRAWHFGTGPAFSRIVKRTAAIFVRALKLSLRPRLLAQLHPKSCLSLKGKTEQEVYRSRFVSSHVKKKVFAV